jgi:DNA-binding NarL/FixJ family response regulator
VRVALAEDGLLFREGVIRLLGEVGFTVTACCSTGDELLAAVAEQPPDVALLDIRMPPTHTDEGVRAALEIRARHPSVGVLVLSQYVELGLALQLFEESMEGVGYLLKDSVGDLGEFADAVRRVAAGGSAVDPAIVSQLLSRHRGPDPLDAITPREREVLQLMAEGRSNQGIAERLEVTERAVQKHITSIFAKLRLTASDDDHRRVLAVLAYLRTNPRG